MVSAKLTANPQTLPEAFLLLEVDRVVAVNLIERIFSLPNFLIKKHENLP
jgi:hypothetical protein